MAMMSFFEVAQSTLVAVAAALTNPVGRMCVYPGDIAWDDCDCDGLLAATYSRFYPSESFPSENVSEFVGVGCAPPYDVGELTVLLARCTPVPDERANAPTCAALESNAQMLYDEAPIIRRAVAKHLCDLEDQGRISARHIRDTVFNGPSGACVGSTTRAMIGLPACLGCDD
jgi:hypothetical protein